MFKTVGLIVFKFEVEGDRKTPHSEAKEAGRLALSEAKG